ncbi:hypothetical protein ACFX1X_020835 [Malus domestica]
MVPNKSFNSKSSPTKASSMEDNYKCSKASHYLNQDSVKQNQFMVPNKSFNSKASPTKASSMKDNCKFSKASHYLDQDSVKQNQSMVPNKSFTHKSFTNKNFNTKASPTKASPTKASSMEANYKFLKASHYLDQDSVKQNQFMVPNKSFTYKASTPKLHLQKIHPQ